MIQVSAGIITAPDGRILVCQRGEGRNNAHLWEFPGGKRENGEDAAVCLVRELMEELKLPVRNVRPLCEQTAQGIHFTFLACEAMGTPFATEHEAIRFVQPREMLSLPFCPADTAVAHALAMNAPRLRHFFWDFDGTLMDTYPAMLSALMQGCASMNIQESPEDVLRLMKNTLRYAIDTLAVRHKVDREALYQAYMAAWQRVDQRMIRPIEGIPQVLLALKRMGGRHYLVTHRDRKALEMLEHAGLLRLFTGFVTEEDGFPRKPEPDSCLHLLRTYRIDPAEAVMIGDRPLDTAAGRGAGMLSCLLDEEGRFPMDPCELRVTQASELLNTLCPRPLAL